MCGIVGFVNKNIKNKKKIIESMSEKIIHRGPDGCGYYIDNNIAMSHRRLSIIDLSQGGQPIYNEDKSIAIIFNGEIYNYQELKEELIDLGHKFTTNSDTETIIHGYEEWNHDVVNHLRGMFAFAIWNKNSNELFLARDHFGIKPLYYAMFDNTFMFSSEIKALLPHPHFKKELNKDILSAYLCFNSTPTTETFFKHVYRLEPGHILVYKNNEINIKRYFHLEFIETNDDMDTIVENISNALSNSIKYHSISDVEVGSFLSSGIDSSYLVSLLKPNKTYTVGYENPKYDEISYAKDLADKLGIENKSTIITKEKYINEFPKIIYYMDEPLADPSAIALYFVAELASKDLKVVTSGEGADELFGGYLNYKVEIDQSWYMKVPYPIRKCLSLIASIFPDMKGFNYLYRMGQKLEDYNIGLGRVFRDSEAMKLVNFKHQIKTKDITKNIYKDYKNNSNLVKRQAIDFYFWLVKDFLHAVDRNTMMFSLEARTPFLDKEVYEVARRLPTYAKINKKTTKPALREAAKKIIPNEAYKKKKLGFPVPLREWIKEDDLYQKIEEEFNSDNAGYLFNQKRILKLLNDHKNNKKIWNIYTFLVWYKEYF